MSHASHSLPAMLNLFQSNQMSELASLFCARNSKTEDPFEPLTVIVQSFGIGQWLKLRLATNQGISANVDCVLPATFLWQLYQQLIPESRGLVESPFERDRLVWRIMRLLDEHPDISPAVSHYLASPGDADLRLFQLAQELALLLDEYLMYRPEWALEWQDENASLTGDAVWQACLWRLILADVPAYAGLHRASLHQQTIATLNAGDAALSWNRISVFGLSTLPPLQLHTFEVLAQHFDIDIYFLNPCAHYWGDIVSEKDKARKSIRSLLDTTAPMTDEDYLEVGNPLLSSIGKQGREFLELLLESNQVNTVEHFEANAPGSSLNYVKNDILELTYGGEFGSDCIPGKHQSADSSVQVHICHSRMREVEVLHDEILRAIKSDPELQPGDIIVMVPDIAAYAAFIQSVFSGSLPYRIADRTSLDESSLLAAFLWLIDLPASRLTASDIMDLLDVPAVMRRFELDASDLETITYWINAAGIRWEADGASKTALWGLPGDNQNTWLFGLKRLLLGFAMSPDQGPWQDTLAFEISPAEAELAGRLCHMIDLLTAYRDRLNQAQSIDTWQTLITGLLEDFFLPVADESLEVAEILAFSETLLDRSRAADWARPVSQQLLAHTLALGLSATDARAGFISGGITFATLVPMRSIPFSMVCLLGMNDGEYPRDVRPHSFDLIAAGKPRRGDRSKRQDDRYLFLEALLSSKSVFYCSYIGKGIRDNKDRPPSAVLGEFQAYLEAVLINFEPVVHALQPFNRRYYQGDEQASFTHNWYGALTEPASTKFIDGPLPRDPSLNCTNVAELGRFLSHPARFFMQERLGVYLDRDDVELKDVEPFELNPLEKHSLADSALRHLFQRLDLDDFRQSILHSGQVLAGPVGSQQLEQQIEQAGVIYETAEPYLIGEAGTLTSRIQIGDQSLFLQTGNLYGDHLLNYQAGSLWSRQLLTAWVKHLAICTLDRGITSICIYKGKKDDAELLTFQPLRADDAEETLSVVLNLFDDNLITPLFLPAQASRTYTAGLDGGADHALTAALKEWSSESATAEGGDTYWSRLFDLPDAFQGRFGNDAPLIWQPLLEAMTDD